LVVATLSSARGAAEVGFTMDWGRGDGEDEGEAMFPFLDYFDLQMRG
jgi:hypothetical protein